MSALVAGEGAGDARRRGNAEDDAGKGEAHAHDPSGREFVDGGLDDHRAHAPNGGRQKQRRLVGP